MRFGAILFILSMTFGGTFVSAECAKILRDVQAPVRNSSERLPLKTGEFYKIKAKAPSRTKYSLIVGDKQVVVTADVISVLPACSDAASASTNLPLWSFGLDAGMLSGMSKDAYDGLVTAVPNPNNVGSLQDPIITGVSFREGFNIRGIAERNIGAMMRAQGSLGYRDQTFRYRARPNPTLSAVAIGDLIEYEKDFSLHQIETGMAFGLHHDFGGHYSFGYGLQGNLLFNLDGPQKINVLLSSGSFFKNTPSTVSAGPPSVAFEGLLRLEFRAWGVVGHFSVTHEQGFIFGLGYMY